VRAEGAMECGGMTPLSIGPDIAKRRHGAALQSRLRRLPVCVAPGDTLNERYPGVRLFLYLWMI
jgi:hypothetical protein